MKKHIFLLSLLFLLYGCSQKVEVFSHQGLPFSETTKLITIQELDKTYLNFIRYRQPVRLQGKIKYQCKIKGQWAFVEDETGLVFVDFSPTSPNINLPTKQYPYPITIEGIVTPDETVLNNYHIIPKGYKFIPN